ncbi:hypothetical protein [Pantoea sp.]|uniref:hypothetical protein n=1 Tax=Pantoea sp. TaxID=69393 RepID=UPI0028A22C0C|nr:hypothetical protein [Pantoea sp.]
MRKIFLKKLNYFLQMLESSPNDALISSIEEYILSQKGLLDESKNSVMLLESLANRENESDKTKKIFIALYCFWLSAMQHAKPEIFYFGQLDNARKLIAHLNPAILTNVHFLSGKESNQENIDKYFHKIEGSHAALVIYDPEGYKLASKVNNDTVLSCISLLELFYFNHIPTSDKLNINTLYLAKQYSTLINKDHRTVIIGNSYGYMAYLTHLPIVALICLLTAWVLNRCSFLWNISLKILAILKIIFFALAISIFIATY